MKPPVRIAISGAAGQIGYALVFRVAAGAMLGLDRPVALRLLEIPVAMKALEGVVMELLDCAFPLLQDVEVSDDAASAFEAAEVAMLVGSRPRGPGMERKDLLEANGAIFGPQGRSLNEHAARDVKVLVVGNPANTNCLIAMRNAPDLAREQFSAMTRLDHNRAVAQLAARTGTSAGAVRRMIIWGNHSSTQVPDLDHALVDERPARSLVEADWVTRHFVPTVQQRGAAVIAARGASSAASAASAAIDHVRDWVRGTPEGDWVSMAIPSGGQYGTADGLVYSFPVAAEQGRVRVIEGLELSDEVRRRMRVSERELQEEQQAVAHLL